MEAAGAVRPAQHGALDAKGIEGKAPFGAVFQDGQRLLAAFHRQAGMPQELDTGVAQLVEQGPRIGTEQRLRASAAATALQPEHLHSACSKP